MKFPNTPSYTGPMTPVRIEADIADLEVDGEVPKELDGAFYRVQPDPQYPPKLGDDIAFNGDGMVSMFRFKDGRVNVKQRWIHTDKWKLEREVGKSLFGAYRNPLGDDPSVKGVYRGTANTNIYFHGGRMFGLKEDSPPVAMDANTLETIGYWDFDGQVTSPTFTAHPKIDPRDGRMCCFGYAAKGLLTRDIVYYEIGLDGKKLKEVWFEIPYYCMMHDFGVTEDYAVFHVVPITSDWDRLRAGKPHFGFDTTMDIHLMVLPRAGDTKDIRTFTAPNCFASHVMNAFNDGTKIHFDTPEAKNNMFPFFPDFHGAPYDPEGAKSYLTRWTVDLSSNSTAFASRQRLTEFSGEFPRIDERWAMQPYRHGWLLGMRTPAGGRGSLAHVDHTTGKTELWQAEPDKMLQEPCFIPRSAEQGDGWIVQIQAHIEGGNSDLLLFDAQKVADGPVATIHIPFRMRFGLHGNWVDGKELATAIPAHA